MAGILGEIAAAKSLLIDLYDFSSTLKSAGADIGGVDLRLWNSWLLLGRYFVVLERRLELLEDREVEHLRQWFCTIKKLVKGCMRTVRGYERRGVLGKLGWGLYGEEVVTMEKKVREMVDGLMGWVVVLDAGHRKEPASLQGQGGRNEETKRAGCLVASQVRDLNHGSEPPARIGLSQHLAIEGASRSGGAGFGTVSHVRVTPHHRGLPPISITFAESDLIGAGSYGTVFQSAQVSGDAHDRRYAIKKFSGEAARMSFEQELKALEALQSSGHQNITLHNSGWRQDGDFYILFPLAQGDLRSMFRQSPPPLGLRAEQWMVEQMAGLASAVDYLHNGLLAPKRDEAALCHGDLKPENILLFSDRPGQSTLFKISDFGSAVTYDPAATSGKQPSGSKSAYETGLAVSSGGTAMYAPPPHGGTVSDGAAGDMWALGCIFLELLAWYLRPPGYTALSFQQSRVQTIRSDQNESEEVSSSSFWTTDAVMRPCLHPAVRELLDTIKQLAMRSEWLLDIPHYIERLLCLKTETRMIANDLSVVLQHGMRLKKLAFGNDTAPFVIADGKSLLSKVEASRTAGGSEQRQSDADAAPPKSLLQFKSAPPSKSPVAGGFETIGMEPRALRKRHRHQDVSLRQRYKSG